MRLATLLPLLLGFAAVLQGGLNRQIASAIGLSQAALLNSLVLMLATGGLVLWTRYQPQDLPPFFHLKPGLPGLSWWWLLPGLLGIGLVTGIPWAIARLGAFPVFLGILTGQLVLSVVWDAVVEQRPMTLVRLLGAALAMVGAWLVGRQG